MLSAFGFCLLFVVYVYFLYPLSLYLLSKSKHVAAPTDKYVGDVTIVMVVCNEEANVAFKIKNIQDLNFKGGNKKIIVVDDASDDGTLSILNGFKGVTVIESKERRGKSNGLNLAMKEVTTELVMLVDCRQNLELNVLIHLTSWFVNNPKMGAVSGELMFKKQGSNDFSNGMDGYWRYEKFIRKAEAAIASVPGVTGALYILRSSLFENLPNNTLLDDVQIPMVASKKGFRVGFDDRAIAWDTPSICAAKERSRKIRTLSGNYQLLFRFPEWVLPGGHPIWWQFFSHKIARLLAPLFAVASFILAGIMCVQGSDWPVWYLSLFTMALLIAPLSFRFLVINKIPFIKLLVSFVTLNWFCILALINYFSVSSTGTWKR
jgi:biofilm PGA synthesis N-glycosyltransferase PgaC